MHHLSPPPPRIKWVMCGEKNILHIKNILSWSKINLIFTAMVHRPHNDLSLILDNKNYHDFCKAMSYLATCGVAHVNATNSGWYFHNIHNVNMNGWGEGVICRFLQKERNWWKYRLSWSTPTPPISFVICCTSEQWLVLKQKICCLDNKSNT